MMAMISVVVGLQLSTIALVVTLISHVGSLGERVAGLEQAVWPHRGGS